MNRAAVAARHADYYAGNMPKFMPNKKPERIDDAIKWTGDYARNVLPGLLIARDDPAVLATKEEARDQ